MSGKIESQIYGRKWQFTKEEIENHSPSRNDGIDSKSESHLRKLYCTFIQEVGIKLKVPQVTIACAMMLCHQFYMRQSHAKNDWQTVATACIFLACKVEETPRYINDSVVVSYEMMNKWDPSAPRRIRVREVFDKHKELILVAEKLILSTIAFDLNIQLPYKPLITALKKLEILPDLAKVAWNFINDWIRTTLCLQYKPHYIAAGSLFLAAKLQKVKLPTEKGRVWWKQFDVSLKELEEVIQEMRRLLGHDRKPAPPSTDRRLGKYPLQSSSQSCVSSVSVADCHLRHKDPENARNPVEYGHRTPVDNATSNSGSASSVVEDGNGEVQPSTVDSDHKPQSEVVFARHGSRKIDVDRIREVLKKRKYERVVKKSLESVEVESGSEAWIESQLENGIELGYASIEKKERVGVVRF